MKYENPVLRGFHPDPSICRDGEDYYLVTSSFEYFPGLPVFHSTDLVNWEQIGNCVQRADEFPLDKVGDSGGIWAPTIRFSNGRFWVTATLEKYGNFIIHAENPAGEWSSPVWTDIGGIDPSLYFEGDRVFYCTNASLHTGQEEITMQEIDPVSGKSLSQPRTLWRGIGGGFLEAPHIYHIGGWYYLLTAEGGTSFNHMATIARSHNIWGPYEGCPDNPVLTNVHDTSKQVQCSGHADLFEDHTGKWWMVHLGIRPARRTMSHLGRETFLTPVVFRDGWPCVEHHGMARLQEEGAVSGRRPAFRFRADFSSPEWEPHWIFLRHPLKAAYRRENARLLLKPSLTTLSDAGSPTFAAVRQPDFACSLQVSFLFTPMEEGDEAGVAILLDSQFHYRLCLRRTDGRQLLVLDRTAEDLRETTVLEEYVQSAEPLTIRVCAQREKYDFYICGAGREHNTVPAASASTRFLSCEVAGRSFTGTVWGVYTQALRETDSVMQVLDFQCWTQEGE